MGSICSKCSYLLICDALHKDSTVECEDFKSNIITNADRIRSMPDEELAKKISGIESFALTCGGGWPPEKWLDWLKREVNDG